MIDTFIETLEYFPRGLVYVALGIVVLYIAKWVLDFVTPYRVGDQLGEKTNTALGLSITGYFLGVIIVFVAVLYTPVTAGAEYEWQYNADFGFDVLGGLPLLARCHRGAELDPVPGRPPGALQVQRREGGHRGPERRERRRGDGGLHRRVARDCGLTGGIQRHSSLESRPPAPSKSLFVRSSFFLLGMGVLVLYALFYQITTAYDIHEEIEKNNVAVGITMAANLIAIADGDPSRQWRASSSGGARVSYRSPRSR